MLNKLRLLGIGKSFFLAGIFFLASAPFISSIFFLLSLALSFYIGLPKIIEDKWNYPLALLAFILVIIAFIHNVYYINIETEIKEKIFSWNPSASWLGLVNWIPLFLCFMGFQAFLSNKKDRKVCAQYLVAGSLPVLVTGFGQYFFEWYGPLQTFNKLVVWFQYPLEEGQGLEGLFSNQNYAGCWLNIIWPFSISFLFDKSLNIFKKSFSVFLIISFSVAIFLTSSRSALGGLLLTLPLLFGKNIFLLLFTLTILFISFINLNIYIPELLRKLTPLVPDKMNLFNEFNPANYENFSETRIGIMSFATQMILNKPFLGWGAASFSYYNFLETYIYTGHPHNLFLELAFSYGFLPSLFFFAYVISLCFISLKIVYFKKMKLDFNDLFYEKAWLTSFFVLLISQMIDIQYFDLRISLAFWILLAGMRSIIRENNKDKKLI